MGKNYRKFMVLLSVLAWLILLDEAIGVHIENRRAEAVSSDELTAAAVPAAEPEIFPEPTNMPGTSAGLTDEPETSPAVAAESEITSVPSDISGISKAPAGSSEADESSFSLAAADYEEPQIRVLIMDTDYSTYYHPSVTVLQEGQERIYTPESVQAEGGTVVLDGGEDGITVTSIERQEGNPVYPGILEIHAAGEGLLLINELPLESYLEAVVPSEMPASYGLEALKAQAVCARTYACKQMEDGKLRESYGADVDDSVSFQVYRNIAPKEETSRAVRATEGQVLTQDGELIEAYYFSTSAGVTSTDEIWGAGEAASYLKSVECDFDSGEPWRRWSVTIPWETLESRAGSLAGCSGSLLSVSAAVKNESGAVTELEVITQGGSTRISGEYEIRQFLSPQGLSITESNGETTTGGALLPSAYFTMSLSAGESVSIDGGGLGHGVGMSQTAANTMADEGYTCEEILEYFFQDIELTALSGLFSE